MKVIFNCSIFEFHKDYCYNIAKELMDRGHIAIIEEDRNTFHSDADFTIQPDEACLRMGGKGIWINHAFPFIPQNEFYSSGGFIEELNRNSDYIFTFSDEWVENQKHYGLPIFNVGMPKLDNFSRTQTDEFNILYVPTWNEELTSSRAIDIEMLKTKGNLIYRGHPAFNTSEIPLMEALSIADVVVTDYSSVGLESIVLDIPTIFYTNERYSSVGDHISNKAMEAGICVSDNAALEVAIETYRNNPSFLSIEREKYSKILASNLGGSSICFVNTLEKIKSECI
jgi:CDP-glycerol glycerophosphotransferase (TagB/SpsB family)